jgi:flagellar hook-length control protein FliK
LAGGRPDSRDGDRTDALNRQDQAAAKTSSAPNPAGTPAAGSGAAHTLRDAGAAAATGSGLSAKTAEKSSEPTADPVQQADHKNGAGATTTERFAATDTSGERAGAVKNSPHPGGGMAGEPAVAWPFGEGREAGAPILPPRQDSGGITVPHATSGDGAASKDIQAQVLDQVLTHGLGHRTGGDGPETLTLRLDPPHLGKVGVQIQRDGDRLIITFRAEAAEAEAALREGAKGLAEGILGQRPHWSNVEIRWERTESEGRQQR